MTATSSRSLTYVCLAAIVISLCLSGCGGSVLIAGTTPVNGDPNAPIVFVEGINPPGNVPFIGFDISYVDAKTGDYFFSSSGPDVGILEINMDTVLYGGAPTMNIIDPLAPNSFTGSIVDAEGNTCVDPNNCYAGGPAGVLSIDTTGSMNNQSGVPITELWAGDAQTYNNGSPVYDPANDDCNSSVKVIDLVNSTMAINSASTVYTNGCEGSDELSYDSNTGDDPYYVPNVSTTGGLILITNPDENPADVGNRKPGVPTGPFVSLISVSAHKVLAQIPFDGTNNTPNATGGIEQPVYSPATGLFYVAVPDDGDPNTSGGAIAIINPATLQPIGKYTLTNCNPNGMALGPDKMEVFLGCNEYGGPPGGPQVISLVDGSMLASFPQSVPAPSGAFYGNQCDEVWYNPALNDYLGACQFSYNNANITVIDAGTGLDASKIKFLQNIATDTNGYNAIGASHSVASDPYTGAVLVPLPMGDPLCPTYSLTNPPLGLGCLGVFAPQGSALQQGLR